MWGKITGKQIEDCVTLDEIDSLSDGLTEKDLIFSNAGEQTVYLELPKNINVTRSTWDLGGHKNIGAIEEDIENAYSCGLNWASNGPCGRAVDENWGTYGMREPGYTPWIEISYTIPAGISSADWTYRSADVVGALDVSYWDYSLNDWQSWFTDPSDSAHISTKEIPDSALTGSVLRFNITVDYLFYEEKVTWYNTTYPTNPYLEVGTSDETNEWSYSGEFSITETTPDFSVEINNYLESCTADANGDCLVPLTFHSDSAGIIQISDINIIYSQICSDETSCTNVGGYWYDSVCNSEPQQQEQNDSTNDTTTTTDQTTTTSQQTQTTTTTTGGGSSPSKTFGNGGTFEETESSIEEESEEGERIIKETKKFEDENGNQVEIKSSVRIEADGSSVREEERIFTDKDGNEIKIKIKSEIKIDGTVITNENREFVNKDGNLVEIKFETETKGGDIKIKREIIVEGKGVQSGLEIFEKFEGGEVKLKAPLSDGREQEIKIMPDRASEIASERLGIHNFSIELREVGKGEDIKAVYLAKGDKPGRLLGLFDVNLSVEIQIDPETGEIIKYKKPWWAFLVAKSSEPEELITNETNISVPIPAPTNITNISEFPTNQTNYTVPPTNHTIPANETNQTNVTSPINITNMTS